MSQLSFFVAPRLKAAALVLAVASLAAPALLAAPAPVAPAAPRFLRQPSISADGGQIVFTYRGDLWKVSSQGGAARQLTSHPAYDTAPVFSPDGKQVAFASDRHGQLDVFVMDAGGGEARRLTFNSADDLPSSFSADGKQIYFTSGRLDAPDAYLTRMRANETYAVDAAGGRAQMLLTTPADSLRPSPDGRFLAYHDQKGFEDVFRKHHTSSVARDLWLFEPKTGRHQQLTTWKGEDRQPAFVDGGKALAFLSERDGSFNVYQMPLGPGAGPDQLASPGEAKALTHFKQHPVRYLSAAGNGTLAFNILGDLYVMPPGGEAKKLEIEILADRQTNERRLTTVTEGATEFAISPLGDEVAFVVRGEIFAASIEHGTTRRLTNTPQQERSLSFAPDGRSLYFAAERGDSWDILKTSIVREDEDRFFEATSLKEEVVAGGPGEQFQPVVSPDGKSLAYLHDRDELRVRSLEAGGDKAAGDRIVVPARQNYSYQDGDIEYGFSPDSRWLAATYYGYQRWINEVGLIDLEKNQLVNLTDSGYHEGAPLWSPDGRALLFFSDREGKRAHGSHSVDGDIYSLAVDSAAFDRARLSVEELERLKKKEEDGEEDGKSGGKDGDKGGKGKGDQKKKPVKPIAFELEGRDARLNRLTLSSAPIADYDVSPDGESVVYIAKVEENWDVYLTKWRDRESSRLVELGDEQPGQVAFNADGDKVVVQKGDGKLVYLEVEGSGKKKNGNGGGGGGGGKPSAKPIAFKGELQIDPVAERRYFFDHAWRQVEQKFYQANLHGADWPALREAYGAYLADLATPRDFVELLSEMLGELNASHTGSRYRPKPAADGDRTASLGLIYDPKDRGAGLLVAELLPRGPAKRAGSKIAPGVRLLSIDGIEIGDKTDPAMLLNRKEGQRVLLGFKDAKGQAFEEVVKPISLREEGELLYERFVDREVKLVEKLSGGRIGYVHVAGMNDPSFRRFYRDALGRASDKEALIVDTRGNGGGWLHDDLVSFLEGRQYLRFQPRNKTVGEFGNEPLQRWSRPSVVVQNEENYSDAHVFPYVYQHLKVGKLIGSPVAGTGTAVWWERQIDGETVFGIPQVGLVTEDGKYLENLDLQPDVLVRNDPESVNRGHDRQIEKAVEVLLQELGPKK